MKLFGPGQGYITYRVNADSNKWDMGTDNTLTTFALEIDKDFISMQLGILVKTLQLWHCLCS